ncbi:MAG: type II toxin-antitoxin system VapC family toxin [Tepidisphaeraceae bacterium]
MAAAKSTVYVETTIPSYLTAWPSRDLLIAGHQQLTREWWRDSRLRYELLVSDLVVTEISRGDPAAAKDRLDRVADLPQLATTQAVRELAEDYIGLLGLPPDAYADAVHIALSVLNGIDYLLTWNCRHLANAQVMRTITRENAARGLPVPLIVTPEELLQMEAPQ